MAGANSRSLSFSTVNLGREIALRFYTAMFSLQRREHSSTSDGNLSILTLTESFTTALRFHDWMVFCYWVQK